MMALYLFPGQGAKIQASKKELVSPATAYIFETLDDMMEQEHGIVDYSETRIFSQDPKIQLTAGEKQATGLAVSLAKAVEKEESGTAVDVCAGDSAGEYSMITFAEVFGDKRNPESLKKAYRLTLKRGELTSSCKPDGPEPTKEMSYLMMIVGVPRPLIDEAVESVPPIFGRAWVSKVNDEKSIGIGGDLLAVKYAADYLVKKGVPSRYCITVNTDSPVHTPLMEKAKKGLEEELKDIPFHEPKKKVIMMSTGKIETDPNKIKTCLTNIMTATADLNRSIVHAVSLGVKDVLCATVCRMYKKMIKRRKDVKPVD
ncbi:hypothetical protein KY310_04145 [Candidatus Woesearchaeota archaeon]|nr:hypothetical protein [Candidatus Woesearchaeota archaeon]